MHYYIYCKEQNITIPQKDAIAEYTKRLSAYCDIHFIPDAKCTVPEHFSISNHQILYIEKNLSSYSSLEFAEQIRKFESGGKSNLHLYIGYPYTEFHKVFADYKDIPVMTMAISNCDLSDCTLSILLYEQIYRGYTIIQGKTYHK